MASTPLDLPILISQLPNLQQIMGPQHVPHEAQQMMFGQLVAENQQKAEQTVQEVEPESGMDAMGRDTGGNKNATQQHPQRQHKEQLDTTDDSAPSTQASNASPWSGNIINLKI